MTFTTRSFSNLTERTYWPYGFHGQQIRWDGRDPNKIVGRWIPGTLEKARKLYGLPKDHGAWFVIKAQYAVKAELPPPMIAQMREAVKEGYLLCVQLSEYEHDGHNGPQPATESTPLATRARSFAKRIEAVAGTKNVVLCYGNEWSFSGGVGDPTWLGTEEQWHEREALCAEVWYRLGFYVGVGSDPNSDMVSASLRSRAQKLKARGINPKHAAVLFHSYGGPNAAVPLHARLMARRVAAEGFGASVWSEAAVLVEGNVPPTPLEVRWLARGAAEARRSKSALCHFTIFRSHEDYAKALRIVMESSDAEMDGLAEKFPLISDSAAALNAAGVRSGKIAAGVQNNSWENTPEGKAAYAKTLELYGGKYQS